MVWPPNWVNSLAHSSSADSCPNGEVGIPSWKAYRGWKFEKTNLVSWVSKWSGSMILSVIQCGSVFHNTGPVLQSLAWQITRHLSNSVRLPLVSESVGRKASCRDCCWFFAFRCGKANRNEWCFSDELLIDSKETFIKLILNGLGVCEINFCPRGIQKFPAAKCTLTCLPAVIHRSNLRSLYPSLF